MNCRAASTGKIFVRPHQKCSEKPSRAKIIRSAHVPFNQVFTFTAHKQRILRFWHACIVTVFALPVFKPAGCPPNANASLCAFACWRAGGAGIFADEPPS
jgi:hypothetical protein